MNADDWKLFMLTVKRNFSGKNNAGLRQRIYKLAEQSDSLMELERTVAFTGMGKAALRNCNAALIEAVDKERQEP